MREVIAAAVLSVLLLNGLVSIDGSTCQGTSAWSGCSVSNSGSQVELSGTQRQPGSSHAEQGNSENGNDGAPPEQPMLPPTQCRNELCRGDFEVVVIPDVTLTDLASFVPARPSLTGEPQGVGVVGMPTNVVAAASAQEIPGTLFDRPVLVRFVPSSYRFDYGDGTVRSSPTGGSTWTTLRQADFTPTSTSHVYRSRGTYDVSVTVLYSASVDFGSGWRPVAGYVATTTSGYAVRVVEVHTALVDKTCLENPRGPGC